VVEHSRPRLLLRQPLVHVLLLPVLLLSLLPPLLLCVALLPVLLQPLCVGARKPAFPISGTNPVRTQGAAVYYALLPALAPNGEIPDARGWLPPGSHS
jgi:hypothetical protein